MIHKVSVVSNIFRIRRGEAEGRSITIFFLARILSHSAKKFLKEQFSVSLNSVIEKFYA